MQITLELTEEQELQLEQLRETRKGKTTEEILLQVIDRGLYTLVYRTERNKRVYAEQKADREELKELRKMLKS